MIQYDDTTNESQEYQDFIEKFKPKKTTDDCYTPANIYEAVKVWAVNEYGLEGRPVLRPFYPGGDYIAEDYPPEAVVIDNPPFSILSQICEYYDMIGVDYFLFAPALSLFSTYSGRCHYVLSNSSVTYANGAEVKTSFVTNLGKYKVLVSPELHDVVAAAERENTRAVNPLPRYVYPPEIITPAVLQKIAGQGVRLAFEESECVFIRTLDAQRPFKKSIFGAGFLLSEEAAARHTAALKQGAQNVIDSAGGTPAGTVMTWELSERERELTRR